MDVFECWNCPHHEDNNPYGMDYCMLTGCDCRLVSDCRLQEGKSMSVVGDEATADLSR